MSSRKRASKSSKIPYSNHENGHDEDEVIPKAKFVPHSIGPEEAEAYWVALCNATVPLAEATYPSRPRSLYPFLDTLHKFCKVPDEVEFQIPKLEESAENPLEGYFICYEAYLMRCRLWFPIPEVSIYTSNCFGLSISQVTLTSLQNLIGILVPRYGQGMVMDVDHFEALLGPQQLLGPLIASVRESCTSIFRSTWQQNDPILWPFPVDFTVVRDLLRGGSFYWTYFSRQREVDTNMDGFASRDITVTSHRDRSPKDKGDLPLHGWGLNFAPDNGSGSSNIPFPDCNFDEFLASLPTDFDLPPALDDLSRSRTFAEGSQLINGVGSLSLVKFLYQVLLLTFREIRRAFIHSTQLLKGVTAMGEFLILRPSRKRKSLPA
ncbi:hypothetical protein N665_0141s0007 [Sinapis alba]|nr:hypothetical protein N665_0141s0007 [Sinapis alba]